MRDRDCRDFLKWCLPRLGLRLPGFRKVRGTVCKRVTRRIRSLGLADVHAYRAYLEAHETEWRHLDTLCRIPLSRFWRDREVFDRLATRALPALARLASARGDPAVRAWSAGCASGEEPYSLRLAWSLQAGAGPAGPGIAILATDADETMLARARAGLYQRSSLRNLPADLVERAFEPRDDLCEIRSEYRRGIAFLRQDIREEMPEGPFDLILCRNLVFTYFAAEMQRTLLAALTARLRTDGLLVIGTGETPPEPHPGLVPRGGGTPVYRRSPPDDP